MGDVEPRTLADLKPGSVARIGGLDPAAPPEIAMRLRHLGFREGNPISALRRAPLNDPCIYRLLGYNLCLRLSEARLVRITEVS